jgi:multiple sugar transport system permease protein
MSPKQTRTLLRIVITLLVLAFGMLMVLPFVWTVSASFKRDIDIFKYPIEWIPAFVTTRPYERVLGGLLSESRQTPFMLAYLNSLIVTLPGVIGPLITSTLAGYAFARLRFPGRDAIFVLFLATMIIPEQVLLVPRFMMANWLGIYNTHWALIIPYLVTAFGTFLVRQACLSLPQDLFDAAKIDGAGVLRQIWTVVVPAIAPQLAALAMLLFVWRWNDYAIPLVMLTRPELFTVPLALATFVEDHANTSYAALMAATVMSTAPLVIVFMIANRFFVQSVVSSGVKG